LNSLLSDLIDICKLLDKQLGPVLRRYEFVLLKISGTKKSVDNYPPVCVIRYGELVRKFKKVEQKRFLEIVLSDQLANCRLRFGKGCDIYHAYDLPEWPMTSDSVSGLLSKEAVIELMVEKTQFFLEHANEFFTNSPEFWQSLERK
jgi:hypothetical protein